MDVILKVAVTNGCRPGGPGEEGWPELKHSRAQTAPGLGTCLVTVRNSLRPWQSHYVQSHLGRGPRVDGELQLVSKHTGRKGIFQFSRHGQGGVGGQLFLGNLVRAEGREEESSSGSMRSVQLPCVYQLASQHHSEVRSFVPMLKRKARLREGSVLLTKNPRT